MKNNIRTSSLKQNVVALNSLLTDYFVYWSLPELLDEILSLLDDVDGDLQCGLLLLAESFDQVLDGLHGLGINVVQQLLLELLQPCPQLQEERWRRGVSVRQF